MTPEPSQNYYDLLGVRPSATTEEIRRRYKFLVIAFHPDRFVRTPEHHTLAELRIKQVNEAYRVLSDPQARAQYDMLRLASLGGQAAGQTAPWVAQLQRELDQAHTRIVQLEQEIAAWRTRLDASTNEKTSLQQEQVERESRGRQASQALEAEVNTLKLQLEQMVRERAALDGLLKGQAAQASQKAAQLSQELANSERLVENLTATKAEWEKSSQTRLDLMLKKMNKLQEDLKRRDASLMQQKQAYSALQDQLAHIEHEHHQAQQSWGNALRIKQQEIESLSHASRQAVDVSTREQRSVRLWQMVAVIAIVNTIVLLALFLLR